MLHVALEREARVLEAALEHVLVPSADDVRLAAVRDDGEAVAPEREVALVSLHRRLDHALRQREVALVEAALEHERPLDEVDHLTENPGGVAPLAELVEPLADHALALGRVGLDPGGAERLLVGLRARDLDLAGEEAPPERRAVAPQRLLVELLAGPADRSREAVAALVPAHRLREGEPVDDAPHPVEEQLAPQLLARNARPQEAVAHLELVLGQAVLAREAGRRLLAPRLGRALHGRVRCPLRQVVDADGEPARPDVELRRLDAEVRPDELGELRLGLVARARGELLAADLKQQRRHVPVPPRLVQPARRGRAAPPPARGRARGRCRRRAR